MNEIVVDTAKLAPFFTSVAGLILLGAALALFWLALLAPYYIYKTYHATRQTNTLLERLIQTVAATRRAPPAGK